MHQVKKEADKKEGRVRYTREEEEERNNTEDELNDDQDQENCTR